MKWMVILLAVLLIGCGEDASNERTCQYAFFGRNLETHCTYTFTGSLVNITIDGVGTIFLQLTGTKPGIYQVLSEGTEVWMRLDLGRSICISSNPSGGPPMGGGVEITEGGDILINVYLTCNEGYSYNLFVLE